MTKYGVMYRIGYRPWEGYLEAASASVTQLLDREEVGRPHPPGRALDLGCGRGQYTVELARRGWEAVGVDLEPRAIADAQRAGPAEVTYAVGSVAALEDLGLGTFDFFLDVGCFQGLDAMARAATGRSVSACAAPGATLLMLAFGPRLRRLVEGATQAEVEAAFPAWELVSVDDADTTGLGFPMNRTSPRWYRLRRQD